MNVFVWSLYFAGTIGAFLAIKDELDDEAGDWVVAFLGCWLWPWALFGELVYRQAKSSNED